jgi:hypothetical protein
MFGLLHCWKCATRYTLCVTSDKAAEHSKSRDSWTSKMPPVVFAGVFDTWLFQFTKRRHTHSVYILSLSFFSFLLWFLFYLFSLSLLRPSVMALSYWNITVVKCDVAMSVPQFNSQRAAALRHQIAIVWWKENASYSQEIHHSPAVFRYSYIDIYVHAYVPERGVSINALSCSSSLSFCSFFQFNK